MEAFTGHSGIDDGFQGLAGELANISIRVKLERWLAVHTARVEDQARLPESMLGDSQPPKDSIFRGPNTVFWPLWMPAFMCTHRHTDTYTCTCD